jgi:polyisoprenoid-binding protein YceI
MSSSAVGAGLDYIEMDPFAIAVHATTGAFGERAERVARSRDVRSRKRREAQAPITFKSTSVRPGSGDRWDVTGDLTIRDVTRPVTLDVEYCGAQLDPWGKMRAGFLGRTAINRDEFDISWNQMLETGGFLVGKGVKIDVDVDVEAARPPDRNSAGRVSGEALP